MYWNKQNLLRSGSICPLNSNIRCIEICRSALPRNQQSGWIVTLDVLKYAKSINNLCAILLNSNIRCIEIRWSWNNYRIFCPLNSNIRCIEIHIQLQCANSPGGWIVTLDVLKWYDRWSCWNNEFRLNSNIRCIEIWT